MTAKKRLSRREFVKDTGGLLIGFSVAESGVLPRVFARLGSRSRAPVAAIALLGGLISATVLLGTYEQILSYVVVMDWLFFGLSASCLFVFRARDTKRGIAKRRRRLEVEHQQIFQRGPGVVFVVRLEHFDGIGGAVVELARAGQRLVVKFIFVDKAEPGAQMRLGREHGKSFRILAQCLSQVFLIAQLGQFVNVEVSIGIGLGHGFPGQ